MSPSSMLSTELGLELQRGKAMSRFKKEQRKDRWPGSHQALVPAASSSDPLCSLRVPSHRGGLQGPTLCQALAL